MKQAAYILAMGCKIYLVVNKMEEKIKIRCQIEVGTYRHYKGNLYEVIGMAKHSETLEDMVVYRALYGERCTWVRPAKMWKDLIKTDKGEVKRFTKLE